MAGGRRILPIATLRCKSGDVPTIMNLKPSFLYSNHLHVNQGPGLTM